MIQLEERLYTSTEVAEILGVSLRSVYRYLEEGKLDAEIKTATGRHRFSKKNIMDFLYPDGQEARVSQEKPVATSHPKVVSTESTEPKVSAPVEQPRVTKEPKQDVEEEEPIDWLAKFREAAKKFKEESEVAPKEQPARQEQTPVMEDLRSSSVKYSAEPAFAQEKIVDFTGGASREEKPSSRMVFYRSGLGGLKDIAQNIDKSARNAALEYAFTMNAGLSLFKPIKPFSVLHAYVKSQDLPFFERALSLTPSDESTAQLCLFVSNDVRVYLDRQELHGLYVVSKQKLLEDIQKHGDTLLLDEAKTVL